MGSKRMAVLGAVILGAMFLKHQLYSSPNNNAQKKIQPPAVVVAIPSTKDMIASTITATTTTTASPVFRSLTVDWQDTQLGPGYPDVITSAWSDVGVLKTGDVIRIAATGFNGRAPKKIAVWGWYINIWSGNGRDWVHLKGKDEPSRVLHFNPRPNGGGYIAMNNFIKGKGWGKEKDVNQKNGYPAAWKKENANVPFVLEVEAGETTWNFNLNGEPQPEWSYVRTEKFRDLPLILQMYDMQTLPDPEGKPKVSVLHLDL